MIHEGRKEERAKAGARNWDIWAFMDLYTIESSVNVLKVNDSRRE
jgi:hypothetical protein